jgi:hypothetical protein
VWLEVDKTGSESCPAAGFHSGCFEDSVANKQIALVIKLGV